MAVLAVLALGALGVVSAVTADADATGSAGGAKIGDRVWADRNGNGVQDAGEPGMGGVKVELWAVPERVLVSTKSTTADGWYAFTGLHADRCYRLRVRIPAGYAASPRNASGNRYADSEINAEGTMPKWVCPGWGTLYRHWWDAGLVPDSVTPPPTTTTTTPATTTTAPATTTTNPSVDPQPAIVKGFFFWGPR